jgi:hypothetical protein
MSVGLDGLCGSLLAEYELDGHAPVKTPCASICGKSNFSSFLSQACYVFASNPSRTYGKYGDQR